MPYYNSKYETFQSDKQHIWNRIKDDLKPRVTIDSGFLGYTLQSYISRKHADGTVRTTQSYQKIINNFEPEIDANLSIFKKPEIHTHDELNLGEIPHMFGILALSQFVGATIATLNSTDGMAGSQYTQAKNYIRAFDVISDRVITNLGDN